MSKSPPSITATGSAVSQTPADTDGAVAPVENLMTRRALAEIAKAFGDVDMASMPQVAPTDPCQRTDANPNDWFEPFRNVELLDYTPSMLDEVARDLCWGCSVRTECLEWALANPSQGGILGGTSERARKQIRRDRRQRQLARRIPA